MNVRHLAAASLVAVLAVMAAARPGRRRKRITVWLQVDAQTGWPEAVAAANRQFERRTPARKSTSSTRPGAPPAEVRRDPRGRRRSGRHRDGEHRDDEVHGRRGVRGSDPDKGVVPQLRVVARGPRSAGTFGGQALRRPLLRGVARRHLPQGPLHEGRNQETRPASRSSPRPPEDRQENKEKASRRSTSRAPTGTRDELRLRLRRADRETNKGKWIGKLDRPPRRRLLAYKNFFHATSRANKTTDEAGPIRTTCTPRARGIDVGPGWFSCCVGDTRPTRRSS